MFETLKRIGTIQELKSRIVFTIMMLIVCRIGVFIPVPGINGDLALAFFKQATGASPAQATAQATGASPARLWRAPTHGRPRADGPTEDVRPSACGRAEPT